MRHRVRGRKLGRTTAPRKALIRGLARALILNEEGRITTTISKAKEMRPFVEKLVTLSREDADHRRRRVLKILDDKEATGRLFEDIGPRYVDRPGGYTRILRLDKRLGDKAERAIVEFVLDEAAGAPEAGQGKDTPATIHKPTKAEAEDDKPASAEDDKAADDDSEK